MISSDQRLVYCEVGWKRVLINLLTGERRRMDIKTKGGFLDENYGWPLSRDSWSSDGQSMLFSTSKGRLVNTTILYALNFENMQFSEIYKLDKPGNRLVGAIYSPDKNRIAFLSQDEQYNQNLYVIGANGNDFKSVPLAGTEGAETAANGIYNLKFSNDSSKIFYEDRLFQYSNPSSIYSYIFNLYDISSGTNEQIKPPAEYNEYSRLFYDGERSIMYLNNLYKKPSLSRHVFAESQAQSIPINLPFKSRGSPFTEFSYNGEWLFYRDLEGTNTWSTFAIRTSDGQSFRIFNETEFPLDNAVNELNSKFVYWFP